MNILIDECLPKYLKTVLITHYTRTVQESGWASFKNGQLLQLAEESFDVFLTADQNLSYQQNLKNRKIAIIVFPSNRLPVVRACNEMLLLALDSIQAGEFVTLNFPAAF